MTHSIDVTSTGEIGHLEHLLQEMIVNLKCPPDAFTERFERLCDLVEQRTKSLTEEIAARKKVEGELQASQLRYQTMVEAVTDYVVTVHMEDGKPAGTTHGPGCVAITGYTADEFHSQPYLWINIVPEEDREYVRTRTAEVFRERNAEPFEHRIVRKDGCVRWVRHAPVLQFDSDGRIVLSDGLIRDVTGRKVAELELQASEERKALALQGGDLGTWDWNVVSGCVEFNSRWAEMLGYSLDELDPHVDTWERLVHPDDKPHVTEELDQHLRGETLSYETRHRVRHKSGRWIWVLDKGLVILRDGQGNPLRACGTHLDITEKKQTEERLRITQFSVDKAPEMVMWLEANAQVHYVNEAACALLGYVTDEVLGRPVWSLCPEWPEERYLSEPGRLATDSPLSFDVGFLHKDGTVIPVEVTVNELNYAHERPFYCLSGRDIRERTRTMAALNEVRTKAEVATHAKSEFLATMSHEIRTPLTAILGYADALRLFGDIERAPTSRIEMLSAIKRNGSHLLDLINDILDLSQIEAGQLNLTQTPISPLSLAQEVTANLLERAESKGLALSVECATPIPHQIPADPKHFRQILTNLIGNAIKFTDEGHVLVRLASQDPDSETPFLAVAVEDTGIGISAEMQAVVFEPFTHGHDRQVRRAGGTGLGLSICQRLVARSGGKITLTSDVGKGSVFTFTVPFTRNSPMWQPNASDLAIQQSTHTEREIPKVNLAKTRILIVEDTPDTSDLLTLFLEEAGANVNVASDGIDGVAAAMEVMRAASAYDLVLMDMRIPGLDGYAATRRLRDEGVRCPIVALTAYAMKDDEQACLDAGCNAYITKPIDLFALFETIERLLLPGLSQQLSHESEARARSLVFQKAADSRFQPLLERYLTRLPEMLDQLQSARRKGELDTLCTVVHRLRGTAANYGFPQITAVADECETALRTQSTPEHHQNESLDELTTLVGMVIETERNEEIH